jgi:CW_7 repeat
MSTTEPEAPEVPVEDDDDDKEDDDESDNSLDKVVEEVLAGEWGKGQDQRRRLAEAGYNANEVRAAVTRKRNNL